MATPTLGRIIIYRSAVSHNGADRHPAVITRVWGPSCVNLTVFPDASTPVIKTSVTLFQTEEEADEYIARQLETGGPTAYYSCAHFPTLVP